MNSNRVAASLASEDTESCLRELDRLAPRIGLAEVRLDLMRSFDIARLVAKAPGPAHPHLPAGARARRVQRS